MFFNTHTHTHTHTHAHTHTHTHTHTPAHAHAHTHRPSVIVKCLFFTRVVPIGLQFSNLYNLHMGNSMTKTNNSLFTNHWIVFSPLHP